MREVQGTGGALFVQQLKAAGVEHIFFNPSTGDYPIFDALVDEPGIQLIKGIHEGAVVAMADGYARASGKPGVVIVANIGLPNAMPVIGDWSNSGVDRIGVYANGQWYLDLNNSGAWDGTDRYVPNFGVGMKLGRPSARPSALENTLFVTGLGAVPFIAPWTRGWSSANNSRPTMSSW